MDDSSSSSSGSDTSARHENTIKGRSKIVWVSILLCFAFEAYQMSIPRSRRINAKTLKKEAVNYTHPEAHNNYTHAHTARPPTNTSSNDVQEQSRSAPADETNDSPDLRTTSPVRKDEPNATSIVHDNASISTPTNRSHPTGESLIEAFRLEDISMERSKCGSAKCVLLKKHAPPAGEDEVGYTFAQQGSKHVRGKSCISMQCYWKAWTFIKKLQAAYPEASTLLLGKPQEVTLPDPNATSAFLKTFRKSWQRGPKYSATRPFIMQPVKVVQEPNLLLQRYHDHERMRKYPDIIRYFTDFLDKSNVTEPLSNEVGSVRQSPFCHNFAKDMRTLKSVLDHPKFQCLRYDFQILLDTDGRIHYIDLDRCTENKGKNPGRENAFSFLSDVEIALQRSFDSLNVTCRITDTSETSESLPIEALTSLA